jgi:branched-chain amino acid transport system substrate-binding protein
LRADPHTNGREPAVAEGVLAFREGAPVEKLPGGRFFMEEYSAQKYDNPPETYDPFAFAAMDMILDTIERVGPDR